MNFINTAGKVPAKSGRIRIVLHGGAGSWANDSLTAEEEKECRGAMAQALSAGYKILKDGGKSVEAVEAAVIILEDSPLFNAGKGSAFTHEGDNELDASIMDGATLKAGAAAAVKHIKNPISLARLIMEKTCYVLLAGEGAEAFAKENGMAPVPQDYFFTERAWKSLQRAREKEAEEKNISAEKDNTAASAPDDMKKHGTVGCAALDINGNLAAGTSTGGLTDKYSGRIGDSPIIGAGTYADNNTCAVSATGTGEYFMRLAAARDISAMLEYRNISIQEAADAAVAKVTKLGGDGGVICLDKKGNIAFSFNSGGMARGYINKDGRPVVMIYRDEKDRPFS